MYYEWMNEMHTVKTCQQVCSISVIQIRSYNSRGCKAVCTVSLCVQNVFVYYVLFSQEEGVRVLGRDVKTYVIHGELKVCVFW